MSHLGSSITSFALTLWLYEKTGSALGTAALTICTYAPYVIMSIFTGAITDRFDKIFSHTPENKSSNNSREINLSIHSKTASLSR